MRRPGRRRTRPASARCRPSATRSSVVLPAPLGPMIVTISPARSASETSLSATRAPKATWRPASSTSGDGAALIASSGLTAGSGGTGRALRWSDARQRIPARRPGAADIGVERFDAMDEAVLDQEFERAIDGGRRGARMRAAQRLEEGVGADRLVPAPDQPQHVAPQLGQARTALLAELRGAVERAVDAAVVVVTRGLEGARCRRAGAGHGMPRRLVWTML